jgi:hypothetical protein
MKNRGKDNVREVTTGRMKQSQYVVLLPGEAV